MSWLLNPRIFLLVTTALFILGAIAYAFKRNWPQTIYHASAAMLQISIMMMGK